MLNYQRVVHFSYHNQTTRSGMSNHRVAAQTKSWCLNVSQQVFLSKKPSCSIPYTPCLDYATRLGQNFRIRHQRHPRLISSCFGPISPPIIWPWYLRKKSGWWSWPIPVPPKKCPGLLKGHMPAAGRRWVAVAKQLCPAKGIQVQCPDVVESFPGSDCMMIVFVRPTIAVILQWCMIMYDDVWWCMRGYPMIAHDMRIEWNVHIYIYIYTNIHIHIYIYMCVCLSLYIWFYMCF